MDRDAATRWFPLVSRSRPPGRSLAARIAELREITRRSGTVDHDTRMAMVCEVCNKTALIASDCGLPGLARELCWRQHDVFDAARPLPARAAKLALQPVLNIARQLIREGDGTTAYEMLHQLYRAAQDQATVSLARRQISLREVTNVPDDHRTICTLLWAALLADGAHALTTVGHWQAAAEHATSHRGVGTRLLDGRQVTILSLVEQGKYDRAMALVNDSVTTEPWEQAVASLLRVHCRRAAGHDIHHDIHHDAEAMLTQARELVEQAEPFTVVFRTRVGMTALDLADGYTSVEIPALVKAIIAAASADAYTAREAIANQFLRPAMTDKAQQALAAQVETSGLGRGAMPPELRDDLMAAVAQAEEQLRTLLSRTSMIDAGRKC